MAWQTRLVCAGDHYKFAIVVLYHHQVQTRNLHDAAAHLSIKNRTPT